MLIVSGARPTVALDRGCQALRQRADHEETLAPFVLPPVGGLLVAAQEAAPSVSCREVVYAAATVAICDRAEAEGLTPPLFFRWDLGDGTRGRVRSGTRLRVRRTT
jgi:hypothetical protein